MDKARVKVAICCFAYNQGKYIRQTLEGFVRQRTDFSFVALVHDDASTDATRKIISEYAAKYPDIILPMYEEQNQYSKKDGTLTRIMNDALQGINSQYIAFCEGDDFWTDPLKLQKQIDALENNPDCTISLCRVRTVDREGRELEMTIPHKGFDRNGKVRLDDLLDEEFYHGRWTFHTSSFLIRDTAYYAYDRIRKKVFGRFPYGDMPLLLWCLLEGVGYFFSEEMSCYRVMSGGYNSSLAANPQKAITDFRKVAEAYRDFDQYTKGKYHRPIERAARRYEYKAMLVKNPGGILWRLNPRFWPFMPIKQALRRFSPVTYDALKVIYKRIKTNE